MEHDAVTVFQQDYLITDIEDGRSALGLNQRKWDRVTWLYESYMDKELENFNDTLDDQSALQYAFWILTGGLDRRDHRRYGDYRDTAVDYLRQARTATRNGWINDGRRNGCCQRRPGRLSLLRCSGTRTRYDASSGNRPYRLGRIWSKKIP